MKGIITVDIGTTSTRGMLYDANGHLIHMDQQETLPTYFPDGRVEQDATVWQKVLPAALKACAGAAREKDIETVCIAVTAQRSSLIPIDAGGMPLHPAIMWQDRRTADLAQAMGEHNALVYSKTGLKISPVFSAVKMTWLRHNLPHLWAQTDKLIGIQDWVLYLLTGRLVTDHTFGSRTNLFDLQRKRWDPDLLALFEVPERMLCGLVPPGSIVGGLLPALAAETGLPGGLPVVTAGGDQQCAALGLGLFSGARAVTNTGTGSYLIGHSDTPALDAQMRTACNISAVPGAYVVEAAVLTSGTIYRWFAELGLGAGDSGTKGFERLNAEAATAPPGANDLILLPHFKGCGAPYWDPDAKGVFYNLTLSTSRGEMARAILEAIAVEMKESLELVEALCGRVASVSVSGGLTRSDLFNQIQSDAFARPVVRFKSSEATSLGAWIAGAVASGLAPGYPQAFEHAADPGSSVSYVPDPANQPIYERQCRRARALYQALATSEFREQIQ